MPENTLASVGNSKLKSNEPIFCYFIETQRTTRPEDILASVGNSKLKSNEPIFFYFIET
jgi:hypothetical protein